MRQIKFCPNCGSPIVKNTRFCTRCGIKFDIFFSEAPEQSLQPPEYHQEAQQNAEINSEPDADHQKTWESTSHNKPSAAGTDLQHNISTIEKKSGKPSEKSIPPIRSQIDKFLDDLLK